MSKTDIPLDVHIAIDLAGGIAQHRVDQQRLPGVVSDIENIRYLLNEDKSESEVSKDDTLNIVIALCVAENTATAIGLLNNFQPDAFALGVETIGQRLVTTDHFKRIAAAADMARSILTQHWGAVLALADHLVKVEQMTGEELTAFLKAHGVTGPKRDATRPVEPRS